MGKKSFMPLVLSADADVLNRLSVLSETRLAMINGDICEPKLSTALLDTLQAMRSHAIGEEAVGNTFREDVKRLMFPHC